MSRFALRFLLALGLAGALVAASVVMVDLAVQREIDRIPRLAVRTAAEPPTGANYLIVGSDTREFVETEEDEDAFGDPTRETGRRSDTIMVVHVEPNAGRTTILSFPRDLWVDIPGIGRAKLNAAYNSDLGGGPDTVIAALDANFGIEIHHYVEVDFVSFRQVVDAIGTVPVYIDRPAVDDVTGFVAVKAGCYHLNGTQALAWVRSRNLEYLNPATGRLEADPRADIGRIERQQEFIRRLAGTVMARSLRNPFKAREITQRLVANLRVDDRFDKRDAFDLVEAFRTVNPDDTSALEFVTFPYTEGNAGGQAVLFPDHTSAAPLLDRMQRFDARAVESPVVPADVRVRVLNASGRDGLAQDVLDALVDAGFVRGGTGNDERGRVAVTEVRFASGADGKARLVLDWVGAGARLVGDPTLKGADVVVVLGGDFGGLREVATAPGGGDPASGPPPAASPDRAPDAAAACR